uniref:Uncharacterized protein n=1 Tax=Oryza glumipatula TaxID=40148 RepID=A0A0E0B7B9_9ORYZ
MLHEHEKVAAGELVQSALTVDHRNQPEPPAASSQQIGPELTAASAKGGWGGGGESSSLISSIPSSATAASLLCLKGRVVEIEMNRKEEICAGTPRDLSHLTTVISAHCVVGQRQKDGLGGAGLQWLGFRPGDAIARATLGRVHKKDKQFNLSET